MRFDTTRQFADRRSAGRMLAEKLRAYAGRSDAIVLGLPRGGVPVAYEVAGALALPLDVFIVRKLGVPGHEELAMGAIANGGVRVLNHEVIDHLVIPRAAIERVTETEKAELERRLIQYRGSRPPLDLESKQVLLVDDGLATGSTMRAAIAAVKQMRPAAVIVAVPVGAIDTCEELAREADRLICLMKPQWFRSVGEWYEDFTTTTDDQVVELLRQPPAGGQSPPRQDSTRSI